MGLGHVTGSGWLFFEKHRNAGKDRPARIQNDMGRDGDKLRTIDAAGNPSTISGYGDRSRRLRFALTGE